MNEDIISNDELSDNGSIDNKNISKWKEYAIQFILVFLAVTLSFIADNIRENIAEKKIARQNLQDFRNDLFQHEQRYTFYIDNLPKRKTLYDSIVSIFYTKNENKELTILSRLLLAGQVNTVITINTPTYEQLINSGSMRFIENKNLKSDISTYKSRIDDFMNWNDRMITTQNNLAGEMGKIVDIHDFWNPLNNSMDYTPDMLPFTLTDEQRRFIISYYQLFKIHVLGIETSLKGLSKINASLVKMIDKELGIE